MEQPPRTQWDAGHGGRCRSNREEVARTFSTLMAETWLAARCIGVLEDPPERSRRTPPHVWRGRPRPREEPFGWRSHFRNRFVGHVHSSLTRNSAATHSGIGDGGRGRPPHMATLAPKGKGRPCFHDQPLLWPRRLEFTLSEAEGLPHTCGAGALARENSPSAGDPILETDLSAMFIRH